MQFMRVFAVFLLMGSAAQAQGTDWSGLYGGVVLDFASVEIENSTGAVTNDGNGLMAGLEGGYRYDLGDIVLGANTSVIFGSVDIPPVTGALPQNPSLDFLASVGIEAGYDLGQVLVYGGIGYSWATATNASNNRIYDSGAQFEIGADYMLSDTVIVGGGITRTNLDDFNGSDMRVTSFGLRAAYRF